MWIQNHCSMQFGKVVVCDSLQFLEIAMDNLAGIHGGIKEKGEENRVEMVAEL